MAWEELPLRSGHIVLRHKVAPCNPFTPEPKKQILPTYLKKERKFISEVAIIGCVFIFHLRKLWKAKFSILCDAIFLVRLQGKFDIDHCSSPFLVSLLATGGLWRMYQICFITAASWNLIRSGDHAILPQPCTVFLRLCHSSAVWYFYALQCPWPVFTVPTLWVARTSPSSPFTCMPQPFPARLLTLTPLCAICVIVVLSAASPSSPTKGWFTRTTQA